MRLSFSAKRAIAKLATANVIHLVHIANHLREIEKSFSYRYVRVLLANDSDRYVIAQRFSNDILSKWIQTFE